jgi:alkaline phosphatase D
MRDNYTSLYRMDNIPPIMFFFKRIALPILFAIALSLFIFDSNNGGGISLLLDHLAITVFAATENESDSLIISHGIASGDVTNDSAVVWTRSNREAQMHVEYDTDLNFSQPKSANAATLSNQTTDYTSHVKLEGLSPDTLYYYRVWFSTPPISQANTTTSLASDTLTGSFRTSPEPSVLNNRSISFIFAADLGGQKHCRQVDKGGYSIFEKMKEISPDFFIANGDMIYAGDKCPAQGPSDDWKNIPSNFSGIADPNVDWTNTEQVRDTYLKHWQYNRADPYLQGFLKNTSMYSQWDDHEVINDFGALWPYLNSLNKDREGYPNVVNEGRKAFFDYSPIDRNPEEKNRIFRSFNWGPNLDLFILDGRSYRSPNSMADTPENNKTMLGGEQLEWLKTELMNSSAIWKVISSDIPFSVPTGANASILGRDGWANGNETNLSSKTGFERELRQLLRFLDDSNIENVVFVTTDVHFPANILYEVDANDDGDKLIFHEFISGPLSAFRFGTPGGAPIPKLDTTFNPKILYEEGGIFNFGHVEIQKKPEDNLVHLSTQVIDENGFARPGSLLDLKPQQ